MPRKSNTNTTKHFGGICLKRIALPAVSRLYNLEPVGVGTPMVESLTSYLVRIAWSHCVTVGALVAVEISQFINKAHLRFRESTGMSTHFTFAARAMNGVGDTAAEWAAAMQALTMRQELQCLTMLHWKGMVAKTKLLRKNRAWCPDCYEGWRLNGRLIYDPLLWFLDVVKACPIHKRFLRDRCVHCNKQSPVLPRNVQPGFCPNCDLWLGVSPDDVPVEEGVLSIDQLRWQAWIFVHLGTLLSFTPQLVFIPTKKIVADLVSACIRRTTRGDFKLFIRQFSSFNYSTIRLWAQGRVQPELGRLLELCYVAEIPLSDVLTGKLSINDLMQEESSIRSKETYHVTVTESKRIEASLRLMLQESPPPSMHEAATRLGRGYMTLMHHFPALFHQIRQRYSTYKAAIFDREKVSSNLLSAKNASPPPSLNSVAKRQGCSTAFLRLNFPEDCSIITARFASFRKVFANPDEVLVELQAFQAEFPPRPIGQCAELLGCTRENLSRYFPETCHAIGIRYSKYRQKKARERKARRRKIILAVVKIIKEEGIPLTGYQIKRRLPRMKSITNRELETVLSEITADFR